jgi:hypothetical protein
MITNRPRGLAALLLLCAAVFLARPALGNDVADVDVLYIERTPRLSFDPNDMTYSSGLPSPGQAMVYLAHVKNWGPEPLTVQYAWHFDGESAGGGAVVVPAGSRVTVPFEWSWDPADHNLEFVADPFNTLEELMKLNNTVRIRTNALLVGLWVEQTLYDYFHENQYRYNDGSNSFEDWGQRMVRRWNEMMEKAVYPVAPDAMLDRVSLDQVIIVPDGALPLNGGLPTNNPDRTDRTVDMQWGYPYNPEDIEPGGFYAFRWGGPHYIDFGSIHEMNHARFHIDLYGMDVHQDPASGPDAPIQVTDDEGQLVAGTSYMPFLAWQAVHYNKWGDIMGGAPVYNAYSAGAWNWKHHRRGRGNMNSPPDIGVFLQDLPDANHIQFVDQNGVPLVGAEVYVYQASPSSGWYGKRYDNTADLSYVTDAGGYIHMPRNPFGGSGISHGYGFSNAVMILKVRYRGELYFMFQEVTDVNMAYWMSNPPGSMDGYYVWQIDLRDNPTTVPNDSWLGNYFNGQGFETFVVDRTDGSLDFEWPDSPAPGVDGDNFSVHWLGNFPMTEGRKTFSVTSDGGVRLYMDGGLVFDQWDHNGLNTWTWGLYTTATSWAVNPGQPSHYNTRHRFEVRYRHGTGTARVHVSWAEADPPEEVPTNGWRADYYSKTNLTGYITSRLEDAIQNDYDGAPDPQMNSSNWSARWTGDWEFENGTYRFTVTADDGVRAWIDGEQVLNEWHAQAATAHQFDVALAAGTHRVVIEHYDQGGNAEMAVDWEWLGFPYDGVVNLGNWAASPEGVKLGLRVGSSVAVVTLDADGRFAIPFAVDPGQYDVSLKGAPWLRKTLSAVTFPLSEPLVFDLTNGDANGNNTVDLLDLSMVLVDFGQGSSPADLDGVDGVALPDINVVLVNFGKTGDP